MGEATDEVSNDIGLSLPFSYQSPMPAGAETPRYENWVHWLMEGFRCRLSSPPHPWLGTSPSATSLLQPSAVVVRATAVGVAGRWRNRSRIGVRDMLSYQLWENALTPALRATYNFPGPPYL